jgi:hypothetical protein
MRDFFLTNSRWMKAIFEAGERARKDVAQQAKFLFLESVPS